MDVLIFMGQSNMQGSTGEPCFLPATQGVSEYRYLTDELIPLVSPVGEDIGDGLLAGAALGNGSLPPYFCKYYAEKRDCNVVAIHVAKGATAIDEWAAGGERFRLAVDKICAGLKKCAANGSIDRVFVIWLQGESDALRFMPCEEYKQKLIDLKNALKAKFDFCKFGIIRVGYFAWLSDWAAGEPDCKKIADENIMRAQEQAVRDDDDFVMLTTVTEKLSQDKNYLNPKEFGPHYNNFGMEIIGKEAAETLASLIL